MMSHELAQRLLQLPNLPVIVAGSGPYDKISQINPFWLAEWEWPYDFAEFTRLVTIGPEGRRMVRCLCVDLDRTPGGPVSAV